MASGAVSVPPSHALENRVQGFERPRHAEVRQDVPHAIASRERRALHAAPPVTDASASACGRGSATCSAARRAAGAGSAPRGRSGRAGGRVWCRADAYSPRARASADTADRDQRRARRSGRRRNCRAGTGRAARLCPSSAHDTDGTRAAGSPGDGRSGETPRCAPGRCPRAANHA